MLWVCRRRHGVPPGAVTLSYHREQTALMFGFLSVCVIELVCVEILLRSLDAPAGLRGVVLALDAYGIVIALAVIASTIVRPARRHRRRATRPLRRVLRSAHPRHLIAGVQHRRNYNETGMIKTDGDCMALAANSQTNLIVRSGASCRGHNRGLENGRIG